MARRSDRGPTPLFDLADLADAAGCGAATVPPVAVQAQGGPPAYRAWLSRSWGCWVQAGVPAATEEECRRQTEAEWQSDYGWEWRAVLGVEEKPGEVFG